MVNIKMKMRNLKNELSNYMKKIFFPRLKNIRKGILIKIGNIEVDFIFIFLSVFLFINAKSWEILLFSIGITFVYKKIISDIGNIAVLRKK